jgi:hypothetical protein
MPALFGEGWFFGRNCQNYPTERRRESVDHYAIDQWADFTRGLLVGEKRTEMQEHLESGCQRCRQLADFTARLSFCSAGLAANPVPEPVVRRARAIFPVRAPDRSKRGSRLPVELVFDSFLAPAPVGLRATWQQAWQGLYRAGDCSLDLRIEPELKSSRAAVIGQIASQVLPQRDLSSLPVYLSAGNVVVAETLSNLFGEFQLEYDQGPRLKVCIELRDSKSIELPLRKVIQDQPRDKNRTSSRKRRATPQ